MTIFPMGEILAPVLAPSVATPVVMVLDDDARIRAALLQLLVSAGLEVELYSSGAQLFARANFDRAGCLILDASMPCMSGLQVQVRLNRRKVEIPLIFLTGSSDIHTAVTAMRAGAEDFIEKPFDAEQLLSRVRQVIARNCVQRPRNVERRDILRKMNFLTPRECDVLELIVSGNSSKQIGRSLGTSHRTIAIHRRHIMEKMMATSLADLLRMRMLAGKSTVLRTADSE